MELGKEYGALYSSQRDELMKILEELQAKRGTAYGARGVSGRAQSETQSADLQDLLRKLGIIKGGLGAQQLGREQQVADVQTGYKQHEKMTYAQWAENKQAATTAFTRQKELLSIQQAFQQQQADKAKKDARKNMIYSAIAPIVTGGIAGWAMPKAVGVDTKNGGSSWTAALRGMAVGSPAVGMSAAYNWMKPTTTGFGTTPTTSSGGDMDALIKRILAGEFGNLS